MHKERMICCRYQYALQGKLQGGHPGICSFLCNSSDLGEKCLLLYSVVNGGGDGGWRRGYWGCVLRHKSLDKRWGSLALQSSCFVSHLPSLQLDTGDRAGVIPGSLIDSENQAASRLFRTFLSIANWWSGWSYFGNTNWQRKAKMTDGEGDFFQG